MLSFSRNLTRALPAILLIACGSMGLEPRVAQVPSPKAQADPELAIYANARTVVDMTVEELRRDFPKECRDLEFNDDQAELPLLLRKTGESVEALFRDAPNTTSKEQVHRERLRDSGITDITSDQNYNYLVLPGETGLWEETRTDSKGRPLPERKTPDPYLITSGFASLASFFHPQYQDGSRFRLLGRQRSEPNSYVIAFAQKPENGRSRGTFQSLFMVKPAVILCQGFAWVDPQTHQILRMRTDLLAPRMDIQMARQTTEVWFHEVRFKESPHAFWLPREVLVTVKWNGQTYENRHRYSEYLVFSVESLDKLQEPKIKK